MKRILIGIALTFIAAFSAGCTTNKNEMEEPIVKITTTTAKTTTATTITTITTPFTKMTTTTKMTTNTTSANTTTTAATSTTGNSSLLDEEKNNFEKQETLKDEETEENTESFFETSASLDNDTKRTETEAITVDIITEVYSSEKKSTSKDTEIKPSYNEVAREVLEGKWGKDPECKQELEDAGYDYEQVKKKVDELRKEQTDSAEDKGIPNEICVGEFQGTWYHTGGIATKGGSGRILVECNTYNEEIKGSIASRTLYEKYGYSYNGRTIVKLEIDEYPAMNGYYYLDDCCRDSWVIDFYYLGENNNCPFKNTGRIYGIKCWIIN